jgi:hypothetical protein
MIDIDDLKQKLPFITCIRHNGAEFIGIVQNTSDKFISFYDFDSIRTPSEKKKFLYLGDTWWWESNRNLPINIFLPNEMKPFRPYVKSFSLKEAEIVFGPTTSLSNLMQKRIKRRQVSLLRKS